MCAYPILYQEALSCLMISGVQRKSAERKIPETSSTTTTFYGNR